MPLIVEHMQQIIYIHRDQKQLLKADSQISNIQSKRKGQPMVIYSILHKQILHSAPKAKAINPIFTAAKSF